jgi:hypothetical protein
MIKGIILTGTRQHDAGYPRTGEKKKTCSKTFSKGIFFQSSPTRISASNIFTGAQTVQQFFHAQQAEEATKCRYTHKYGKE